MSTAAITAVDCHAHVIDPLRFPLVAGAGYQPRADEVGPREAYAQVLAAHGVSHGLLVQPSCYGFDNRALVDALAAAPRLRKGIAVVAVDAADAELDRLMAAGIVGVRLNLGAFDAAFLERAGAADFLRRMRERELFVQVYAPSRKWARIAPVLAESEVKIIVDHMGEPHVPEGLAQAGFDAVLALGRSGNASVKLSAPYRVAGSAAPYRDVVPFAHACIEAFGVARCMWGSDWPFLNTTQPTSYRDQQTWLEAAVPSATDRHRILVDNPRRLFGFADAHGEEAA